VVTGGSIAVSGRAGVWGYGFGGTSTGSPGTGSGVDWLVHFNGTSTKTKPTKGVILEYES
jgi:hypothetical protein